MIDSLYDKFKPWSATGSVWLVSDTHFDDDDCHLMDPDWIDPAKFAARIKSCAHKNDTLIHLGDVGDISYLESAWKPNKRPYTVLITGNHDKLDARVRAFFDEIYTGPVFIGEKILLSHEPVWGLPWCLNIHGHVHRKDAESDELHLNLAANIFGYEPVRLDRIIKDGAMSNIKSIHRTTILNATENKKAREAAGCSKEDWEG